MRTFIENYLHFIKNCIRPPYKKLKSLKSGFIENSNFENNRDPCGHPKENWFIVELVLATIIIIANCPQENWVIVESASPTATLRSCKPEQSGTDWLAISAERQRMNPDLSCGHFFIGQISRHRRLLSTHLWKYWQLVVTLCVQLRFLQSKFIDYYELAPLLATQRQVCSHG